MKPEKPLTEDDIAGLPDELIEGMKKSGLIAEDKSEDKPLFKQKDKCAGKSIENTEY